MSPIVLLGTWLAVSVVSGQGAGAPRLARVGEFLRRLDANGNGMIEEEEATGLQRQVLERILSRSGITVKFPISIEQVMQAMTSAVRSEGNAATGGGSPPAVAGSAPGPPTAGAAQVGLASSGCRRPSRLSARAFRPSPASARRTAMWQARRWGPVRPPRRIIRRAYLRPRIRANRCRARWRRTSRGDF